MLSKGCKVAEVNPMDTGVVSWQLKKAAIEVVWNVHKKLTTNSSDWISDPITAGPVPCPNGSASPGRLQRQAEDRQMPRSVHLDLIWIMDIGYPKFEVALHSEKMIFFKDSLESIDNTQPFPSSYIYLFIRWCQETIAAAWPQCSAASGACRFGGFYGGEKVPPLPKQQLLPNKYYKLLDLLVTSNITYIYI